MAGASGVVAILAGGTGGAKLARGMLDAVGAEHLTVIANTGDDLEVYGLHVSPDPDLVTYWLADLIDERRGYGVRGESFEVMAALEAAGHDPWFRLGDRDLATCLVRTELLRAGERLTTVTERVSRGLGVAARVVPMADEPVRTHIRSRGRWLAFQEFMVRERAAAPIDGVELRGAEAARAPQEALRAIATAEAIVIGPSNPIVSIGPILRVPGMREAIADAPAPVVAVSPFVRGHAVKGPTDAFCRHAGLGLGAQAVADAYRGLAHGVMADEPLADPAVASLQVDTLMQDPERRRQVAAAALEFAASIARR